jgi:hypothetical protein
MTYEEIQYWFKEKAIRQKQDSGVVVVVAGGSIDIYSTLFTEVDTQRNFTGLILRYNIDCVHSWALYTIKTAPLAEA